MNSLVLEKSSLTYLTLQETNVKYFDLEALIQRREFTETGVGFV